MGNSGAGGAGAVQSVDRAAAILEILARDGEAGVTEVARELGVHKSTASRPIVAHSATIPVSRTHWIRAFTASERTGSGVS